MVPFGYKCLKLLSTNYLESFEQVLNGGYF